MRRDTRDDAVIVRSRGQILDYKAHGYNGVSASFVPQILQESTDRRFVPDCAVSSPGEANIASACCQSAMHWGERPDSWQTSWSLLGHGLRRVRTALTVQLDRLTEQGYVRCLPALQQLSGSVMLSPRFRKS